MFQDLYKTKSERNPSSTAVTAHLRHPQVPPRASFTVPNNPHTSKLSRANIQPCRTSALPVHSTAAGCQRPEINQIPLPQGFKHCLPSPNRQFATRVSAHHPPLKDTSRKPVFGSVDSEEEVNTTNSSTENLPTYTTQPSTQPSRRNMSHPSKTMNGLQQLSSIRLKAGSPPPTPLPPPGSPYKTTINLPRNLTFTAVFPLSKSEVEDLAHVQLLRLWEALLQMKNEPYRSPFVDWNRDTEAYFEKKMVCDDIRKSVAVVEEVLRTKWNEPVSKEESVM